MRGNGSQLGVTVPLTAHMGADKLVCIMLGSVQRASYQPGPGGLRVLMGGVTGHVIRALSVLADEGCFVQHLL